MGAQLPYNTSSNLKPNRAVIRHIKGLRVKLLKFSKFYPKHSSVMIALNANSCNEIDCLMLIYHLSIWKFNFLPFVLYTWWQNDALWRLRQFSDNSKCDHMLFRQCQKSFFRGKVKTVQNVLFHSWRLLVTQKDYFPRPSDDLIECDRPKL